jgi:hypothetical protein
MDITTDNLLGAGYEKFDALPPSSASALFAKYIRDGEDKKLYFLKIYLYDWRELGVDHPKPHSFQPEVQFSLETGTSFEVTYSHGSQPLEEVEQFFADIYKRMKCVAY